MLKATLISVVHVKLCWNPMSRYCTVQIDTVSETVPFDQCYLTLDISAMWGGVLRNFTNTVLLKVHSLQTCEILLITVCTVVQNCCKGDSPCHWKTTIFTPPGIKNPWTNRHQTWYGWLRSGPHLTCKLWYFYPQGGRGCICVKLSSSVSIFYPPPVVFLPPCAPAEVAPFDLFSWFMAQKTVVKMGKTSNRHNFISVQDIETVFACIVGFSGLSNSNMLSEFSREQRELPWQPNLGKNKPKLHLFQFWTRYQDTFCVRVWLSGSPNSNMLFTFSREQRALPRQPKLGKNKPKLHLFQFWTRYREFFRVNNRFIGVGQFKYAISISREQRELPWQPNLGKNKPKLHLFHFSTRYRDTFC